MKMREWIKNRRKSLRNETNGLALLLLFSYFAILVPAVVLYPKLALPGILGVAILGAMLWRPFIGILLVTLLGMVGELQHFAGGISLAKVAILLTLVGYVSHGIIRRKLSIVDTGLEVPMLLFISAYVFGILTNLIVKPGTEDVVTGFADVLTMVGYPLGFVLFLNIVNTKRRIALVLTAVVLGGALAGVASTLGQFFSYNVLTSVRGIEQTTASNGVGGMDRSDGLMKDPNAAAYPELLALPAAILLLIQTKRRLFKLGLVIAAALALFGLALTFSRSGYIAFGVSVLVLPFVLPWHKVAKVYAAATVLLLLLTTLVPVPLLIERFSNIGDERGGESDRSIYFKTAFEELVEHPILPSGEADFISKITEQVGTGQGPHANLQAVMINSGIIGVVSLTWLAFRYLSFVIRGLKYMRDVELRCYALASLLGILAFQIQGLFITNMGWFLMWAVLAIPISCVLCNSAGTTPAQSVGEAASA